MNYAIVNAAGDVINTIVWNGSNWQPPAGTTAIQIPVGVEAGIGWSYVDGDFIAPAQEPLESN